MDSKSQASNMVHNRYKRKNTWWESLCLRCHQEDTTPYWQPRWWSSVCPFPIFPTYRQVSQRCVITFTIFLIWGLAFVVLGDTAAPGGQLFSMVTLVLVAYLVGWIWLKVTTLPALIAMLLVGVLFQNIGLVNFQGNYIKLNSDLRKVALVIILMRAGLGLDSKTLRKSYVAVLQLGLIPWGVECIVIAVTSHYFLDLPWPWTFLLGTMIASVSPAVVVPCLFRLREQTYGVSKGIPTLLLAAAGIDDSISVAAFGIIFSAMFSSSSMSYNIAKGPLSILVGIGGGILWGTLAKIMPEKGDRYATPLRFIMMFFGGLFAVFMSGYIGWSGAGPLAVVSSGFVAAIFWEKQGWQINNNPVCNIFRILWIVFEPILFAFTGAQVKLDELNLEMIKMGVTCLVIGLLIRMIVTLLAAGGCGLNFKEKIFIGVTWLAKATVQAALGPVALDMVMGGGSAGDPQVQELHYAETIMQVSVLSVIMSAPLGALLIAITGPHLLSRDPVLPEQDAANKDDREILALRPDGITAIEHF